MRIAQYNIARLTHPLDAPETKGFVERLDEVNAFADRAPGFVWRLQSEDGDATGYDPYGDPYLIINLSVWDSLEALKAFTYQGAHLEAFRLRRQWFEDREEPMVVLWWVEDGHLPTIEEAADRLDHLRRRGPTAAAFTFARTFAPPSG